MITSSPFALDRLIDARAPQPPEQAQLSELQTRVRLVLGILRHRERAVLQLRYGLAPSVYCYSPMEIAKAFQKNIFVIQRCELCALRRLKRYHSESLRDWDPNSSR